VSEEPNLSSMLKQPTGALIISVIRVGCFALLAYWCFLLVSPFLTIVIWSIIFAVALYPVFAWTADKLGGRQVLAAAGITVVSLLVIFGPATWLALSLINTLLVLKTSSSFAFSCSGAILASRCSQRFMVCKSTEWPALCSRIRRNSSAQVVRTERVKRARTSYR